VIKLNVAFFLFSKMYKYFFLPKSIFEKFFMYLVVVQSQKEICYGHVPNLDN